MEGGPSAFPQGFPCLVVLRIPLAAHLTSPTGLSPSPAGFSKTVPLSYGSLIAVLTPECSRPGLGSFPFARRYLENRCFFLFLRLLRCFSSPGSPPYTMYSCMDTGGLLQWVSPFRDLRIDGYLLLPAAYHVFHRLLVPRHPPCALLRLTNFECPKALTRMYSVTCIGRVLFTIVVF